MPQQYSPNISEDIFERSLANMSSCGRQLFIYFIETLQANTYDGVNSTLLWRKRNAELYSTYNWPKWQAQETSSTTVALL